MDESLRPHGRLDAEELDVPPVERGRDIGRAVEDDQVVKVGVDVPQKTNGIASRTSFHCGRYRMSQKKNAAATRSAMKRTSELG